ncbi:MFS transporter [Nevskia soli]|uniref:MFS transporter n=1 Tax=Nevskia soli TaxID=418856 RepID=UPI00056ABC90|nr:MFS transporter [Nevskia soli]
MSAAPASTDAGITQTAPREISLGFRFLAPLCFGSILNPINSTMIATALSPIRADFHATVAQTGWLIAGLYLASAIAQPTMGRMADVFGPRRVYLFGLLMVAVAGIVGVWAPSLPVLIASRVALGVGTSAAYPTAMAILRARAARLGGPPPRRALSILTFSAITTLVIGPSLGGALTAWFGWQSIFGVNIPMALIGIALVLLWTPKDEPRTAPAGRLLAEFDFVGAALFGITILALMLFLMNLQHPRWLLPPCFLILGTALVLHSLRRPGPFIDVRMLARNRPLRLTYLRLGTYSILAYCMLYGFAQWLENGPGFSSAKAGLMTLPLSIVAAACSIIGGRTKGIRMPMIVGAVAMLAGCLSLLFLHSGSATVAFLGAGLLFGIPQGLYNTSNQAAMYVQAPAAEMGAAAGLQRTALYIGAIAASSLLGFAYGTRPDDQGLHHLALAMSVLSALLVLMTIFDRTVPRAALKLPAAN